jgi:AraC-like DNA-binding protein
MQYRLKQSCQLLLTSELPIGEIAAQTGYDNPLNFSRSFKNAYGISPSEYRQKGGNV